jgi:hypothetical protein
LKSAGGLSEVFYAEEVGFVTVSFGPSIRRAETTVLAAVVLVQQAFFFTPIVLGNYACSCHSVSPFDFFQVSLTRSAPCLKKCEEEFILLGGG